MARDFDLNSQKWLALIFEGKNQTYGAYVHREESSDRHVMALGVIITIALGLIFLPGLIKSVLPAEKHIEQVTELVMTDLDLEQEVPEENTIKEFEPPPPPELKQTVAYTPPVIARNEDIRDDELMLTQQELMETTAEVSIANVEGTNEGINIADLADNKVAVEEPVVKEQIFSHVEQMPEFPGGEGALIKWLYENIQYPPIAQEQGIQGRVSLRFVVRPDGMVDDVQVVKGLDPSCDKEAVRAVKKMPKWIPGRQNGNPVSVYYNLPVTFKLQNS